MQTTSQTSTSQTSKTTAGTQTLTAMFDDRATAERAIATLVGMGIPRTSVTMLPDQARTATTTTTTTGYDTQRDEHGFWASLKNLALPDEDRHAFSEGMHRGGTMIAIQVPGDRLSEVSSVLESSGAYDLDEREATWRQSGYTGYQAGTAQAAVGTARTGDEAIPIVEEQIAVGKRMREGGRVRVRTYVVETPVSEQVRLRQETVHVERVAVDRPVTATEDMFRERTLEATQSSEEAVVSKEARVTGEVRVSKEATERVETVSDTVRRTEVEVEDARTDAARDRTGTTGR